MNRHIHFIGIGGIGVSAIAKLALSKGDKVSGSDLKDSAITLKLAELGAKIFIGHNEGNISGADLIVYSSAIGKDNPELAAALRRGLEVKRRAEFLSELMQDKKVITITGAHGKTTTSSLTAKLLLETGFNPSVAVGGILREDGDNAKSGKSDYFVAEADESDGTFLCYYPDYSIITNIDYEHMDFYGTRENLLKSFYLFVGQTKKRGCIFYCWEDDQLRSIVKSGSARAISFGYSDKADFYAKDIAIKQCHLEFNVFRKGTLLGQATLGLMGRHNVLNALPVIALGMELGLDFASVARAISGFKGVERRFQVKYDDKDVFIVDDYAHHPTEIKATIEAAKFCGRNRLVVVFQPHRYSRTKLLLEQFGRCFEKSDYLLITDIYAAGEKPLSDVSAKDIVDKVRSQTAVAVDYVAREKIVERLKAELRENDFILFLGAGDITKVSDEFTKAIQG